jgi:hypothetical protein
MIGALVRFAGTRRKLRGFSDADRDPIESAGRFILDPPNAAA